MKRIAVAAAFVAGIAFVGWGVYTALGQTTRNESEIFSTSVNPQSTPERAWKAGSVPALYQKDRAWAHEEYAGASFGEAGCGPTCMSMVYIALTGRTDLKPADAGRMSERMGCATEVGTAWTFMEDGARELGLEPEILPASESAVLAALQEGQPVICSVGPGDFTAKGHFIVLTGVDSQGKIIIRDPNSPERTQMTWDINTILNQCLNLWAYKTR